MLSILGSVLLAAGTGLSIQISTPQTSLLVGEPVKVVTRWKALRDANVFLQDADIRPVSNLQFWVDSGLGFKRYREYPRAISDEVVAPAALRSGEERVTNLLLFRGGYVDAGRDVPGFVFPVRGQYTLKVSYSDSKEGVAAESNALTFSVEDPSGDEITVLQSVRSDAKIFDARRAAAAKALLARFPDSRYLKWAKLQLLQENASELQNRYDPETGESLWQLDAGQLTAVRRQHFTRMTEAILSDTNWRALEEESLERAVLYAGMSGDSATADRLKADLLTRFPRSAAAQHVRELDAERAEAAREDQETDDTPPPSSDKTPPTLSLSPSPASLWPPNHKMVTVTLAVTVKDDVDPNPVVKLVSVTCDDGCDPSQDIVGAATNTDDRQFQLRADRSGSGSGRTYTITYSAKDASGNATTKTTTVTVPHDQR